MHDARWQPVWAVVGGLSLCALVASPQVARAQGCAAVDAEVEALIRGGGEAEALLEIARDLGPRGGSALVVRAEAGDATAVLALGLAGQAEGLRALRERRIPRTAARSLALLALGDATETGTVTRALVGPGSAAERARVATYLGMIRAVRARELLEVGLIDPEPLVRLEAAKPLAKLRYPKARRVLVELGRSAPEPIRAAALEANARAPTGNAEELMEELESDNAGPSGADAGTEARTTGKGKDAAPAPAPNTLAIARTRLAGGDGEPLRVAIRVMEQAGARTEVASLIGVARRRDVSSATRAVALGAALRMCPK